MEYIINIEVYDDTDLEKIEEIIGDALNHASVECSYCVEVKTANREGLVFPFATDEIIKSEVVINNIGEEFAHEFASPVDGFYVGDTVIFVNKDVTDILRYNLYKITNISIDKKHFIFAVKGGKVNKNKVADILADFKKEVSPL